LLLTVRSPSTTALPPKVEWPHVLCHWTRPGTNIDPGAPGNPVRINGYEQWRLTNDGLIAESQRRFDQTAYQKQLEDSPNMPLSGHSAQ
jgi:hypothetical protein